MLLDKSNQSFRELEEVILTQTKKFQDQQFPVNSLLSQ
jgi:hypothetical protein